MGTRGLVGFVVDNTPKATYNHFDSYPSGLGMDVVKFVNSIKDADTATLAEQVRNLTPVEDTEEPNAEQTASLAASGVSPANVSTGSDWYSWLRGAQGDLAEYLRLGFMPDGTAFGNDSLFCEWGYLVNLDDETVEVYRGFQTEPHTEGRWSDYDPTADESVGHRSNHYYGVKRIAVIPFADLSIEGMSQIEAEVYGEEEEEE